MGNKRGFVVAHVRKIPAKIKTIAHVSRRQQTDTYSFPKPGCPTNISVCKKFFLQTALGEAFIRGMHIH